MPAHEPVTLPPPTVPLDVAQAFVAARYMHGDNLGLVRWRGDFFAWIGTHWAKLGDDEVRAKIYDFTGDALYRKAGELKPWAPNARRVSDLMDALKAVCRIPDGLQPPCWLYGPSLRTIVPCRNGLLVIDGRTLRAHTPLFFNLASLPFDYDPAAQCSRWDEFTSQLWPDDKEPVSALEEVLGCIVANKTDLQRIPVLVGPPRSGKGTLFKVIEGLVGGGSATTLPLLKLTDDKTLSSLIGKSVCLIPDMRATARRMPEIAEALLSISGQDSFTIDRKYKDPWSGVLDTIILIASNELPTIRDASGALPSRYLPLVMTESWLGREDRTLLPTLLSELAGILNRALDGLDNVIDTGCFTEPKASFEAVEDLSEMASPMKRFVAELLVVMPKGGDPGEYTTPVADLFNIYRTWSNDNNEPPITRETFGMRLRATVPTIKRSQPRGGDGARSSSYAGVRLRHRETVPARVKRLAHEEMARRTEGGVQVIKSGRDDDDL